MHFFSWLVFSVPVLCLLCLWESKETFPLDVQWAELDSHPYLHFVQITVRGTMVATIVRLRVLCLWRLETRSLLRKGRFSAQFLSAFFKRLHKLYFFIKDVVVWTPVTQNERKKSCLYHYNIFSLRILPSPFLFLLHFLKTIASMRQCGTVQHDFFKGHLSRYFTIEILITSLSLPSCQQW